MKKARYANLFGETIGKERKEQWIIPIILRKPDQDGESLNNVSKQIGFDNHKAYLLMLQSYKCICLVNLFPITSKQVCLFICFVSYFLFCFAVVVVVFVIVDEIFR